MNVQFIHGKLCQKESRKKAKKNSRLLATLSFRATEVVCEAESAPNLLSVRDLTGGACFNTPSCLIVLWGGGYPPHSLTHWTPAVSRSRRLHV